MESKQQFFCQGCQTWKPESHRRSGRVCGACVKLIESFSRQRRKARKATVMSKRRLDYFGSL